MRAASAIEPHPPLPDIVWESRSEQVRRRMWPDTAGHVRLEQDVRMRRATGWDATGPRWIFGFVEVLEGRVEFRHGGTPVPVSSGHIGLFVPPYALVEVHLSGAHYRSIGVCSRAPLPPGASEAPIVFRANRAWSSIGVDDIAEVLRTARDRRTIDRTASASATAMRAKRALDAAYATSTPVSAIALECGVSPATLSRSFKQSFGLPPIQYRNLLRATDATMRLAAGEKVLDVSHEVGFADLSRFYHQFRRATCAPPGRYFARSKTAKTR